MKRIRMKRLTLPALVLAAVISTGILTMAQTQTNGSAAPPAPPGAEKVPRPPGGQGGKLSDDFFWMRDKKNPEVIAYLEAENAYTEAMTKGTAELQERLYKEMLGRI